MIQHTGYRPTPVVLPYAPAPPYSPPIAPRRARRATAIVLGVIAAALLITAGVFAGLFTLASGDRDTLAGQLDERRTELGGVTDQVVATEEARDTAAERNTGLETTRSELSACVDVVQRYLWDGLVGAERQAALDQLFTLCQ